VPEKSRKKKTDPQDVINTAAGAAGGIAKPIVDAGTKKPKPKPMPKLPMDAPPDPPEPDIAGGTQKLPPSGSSKPGIDKKKKKKQ
jgi:hypothetical protein